MSNKPKAESSSTAERRKVGAPNRDQEKEDTSIALAICGVNPHQVSNAFLAPRYKLDLPSYIRDSIILDAPRLLESVLRQRWPVTSINIFSSSVPSPNRDGTNKPDRAVAFANRLGTGWMLALHSDILAIHCENIPPLPEHSPAPGELPVIVMRMDVDVISLWILLAIFTYFYNHDQAHLFSTIFGHVYPPWDPMPLFPHGQHKTFTPPLAIDNGIMEDYVRILIERTTRMQRQMLLNNAKGFLDISYSLNIVDLGFHEVVLTASSIALKVADMDQADSAGLDGQDDLYTLGDLLGWECPIESDGRPNSHENIE
ncbi:hypothetical protein DFS33DRAFT_1274298 [Desarmillaria ectypa]|nr:hypothetical protein DFS33DRAFT_1274298 [Desarmillaria ectypa]